ncbi:hypothetical protein SAY86_004300 [Trapa natans]|uniref:BZIP domain-containing protein n=1 Tax=Trapa natans TaxID=22666 RepID=A0AAN7RQ63_TRANT|nr:hypothetical protein SAY86_004300 [Trapa natans]
MIHQSHRWLNNLKYGAVIYNFYGLQRDSMTPKYWSSIVRLKLDSGPLVSPILANTGTNPRLNSPDPVLDIHNMNGSDGPMPSWIAQRDGWCLRMICSNSYVRSMEEVWQEVDLSSLLDHSRPVRAGPTTSIAFYSGGLAAVSLQDFLAGSFHRGNTSISGISSSSNLSPCRGAGSFIPTSPGQPSATAPSLASRSDSTNCFIPQLLRAGGSLHNPFLCKDRSEASSTGEGVDHSEQKRRRLMKNRESAARSRARKHAYTDELESQVIQLQKENARLRMHTHELRVAGLAALPLLPEKQSHRRTLSAPF